MLGVRQELIWTHVLVHSILPPKSHDDLIIQLSLGMSSRSLFERIDLRSSGTASSSGRTLP